MLAESGDSARLILISEIEHYPESVQSTSNFDRLSPRGPSMPFKILCKFLSAYPRYMTSPSQAPKFRYLKNSR